MAHRSKTHNHDLSIESLVVYLSLVVRDDRPVGGDVEELWSERVPHKVTLGL